MVYYFGFVFDMFIFGAKYAYDYAQDFRPYPMRIAVVSSWPSGVLLATPTLIKCFYGTDLSDSENYLVDKEMVDAYLNNVTASYLSVVGVVYSLVVAFLLQSANDNSNRTSYMSCYGNGRCKTACTIN